MYTFIFGHISSLCAVWETFVGPISLSFWLTDNKKENVLKPNIQAAFLSNVGLLWWAFVFSNWQENIIIKTFAFRKNKANWTDPAADETEMYVVCCF